MPYMWGMLFRLPFLLNFFSMKYYTVKQLKTILAEQEDVLLLDTRTLADFAEGFIPGAVLIGNDGGMVEWVKALIDPNTQVALVTPINREQEFYNLLQQEAGLQHILGCLDGGFEAWKEEGGPIDFIINVDAGELAMDIPFDENLVIMDVRKPVEYADGHIKNAINMPLADMKDPVSMAEIDDRQNLYLHCARGYRSIIAASLLKRQGYNNLRNVLGGWESIKHTKGLQFEKEKSALN